MDTRRIVIVGAGPAGIRAAQTLVEHGARPLVIDEGKQSGGQIFRRQPGGFTRGYRQIYGFDAANARNTHQAFDHLLPRIDYRPSTLAWGIDGKTLFLSSADGSGQDTVNFDTLILATGACDRTIPMPGWTRAGVYTLGGAQVALKYQGCAIGDQVVFVGTGPLLYLVAYQYVKAGAKVAAVLDTTPIATTRRLALRLATLPSNLARGLVYLAYLYARQIPIYRGVEPISIEGGADDDAGVQHVLFKDADGATRSIACSAVGMGYGLQAETQMADLAGCAFELDTLSRQWLPYSDLYGRTSVPHVRICGDSARITGAEFARVGGELTALGVLADDGLGHAPLREALLLRRLKKGRAFARTLQEIFPVPHTQLERLPADTVLCRCENVTLGQCCGAGLELGADEINRAKALIRVGMGRCQGRFCGISAATALSNACDLPLASVGRIRGQMPIKPIPIPVSVFGSAPTGEASS